MEEKPQPKKRGGARPGAGRPKLSPDEETVIYTIAVPKSLAEKLRECDPAEVRKALARVVADRFASRSDLA